MTDISFRCSILSQDVCHFLVVGIIQKCSCSLEQILFLQASCPISGSSVTKRLELQPKGVNLNLCF